MDGIPRFRATIDIIPAEQDGEPVLLLRDPERIATTMLCLPVGSLPFLALLDGERGPAEIQAEIMKQGGPLVPRETLDHFFNTLESECFLEGASFRERRARVEEEYLAAPCRPAAHAGGAYPAEPEELARRLAGLLEGAAADPAPAADGAPPARAFLAPHIDLERGGECFARAYRAVARTPAADTVLLLGTAHVGGERLFSLTRKGYATPLGELAADAEFLAALEKRLGPGIFAEELTHRNEHSVEFQALFLRQLFPGRELKIVPVLCNSFADFIETEKEPEQAAEFNDFVAAVRETAAGRERPPLVIAGGDLAHVGPRFGDPRPLDEAQRRRLEEQDRTMLAPLERGDRRGFFGYIAAEKDSRRVCGLPPLYTLLAICEPAGGRLIDYRQCEDEIGPSIVSIAAMEFF